MPTPQEMAMLGGAGGAPKPPMPGGAPGGPPPPAGGAPAGGPMSTPQPQAGKAQAAMVNVEMAIQLLEQSMGAFELASPEKKAVVDAHKTLIGGFGGARGKNSELIPAELMQLLQTIPGIGGGSPAAKSMGALPAGAPAMPQ